MTRVALSHVFFTIFFLSFSFLRGALVHSSGRRPPFELFLACPDLYGASSARCLDYTSGLVVRLQSVIQRNSIKLIQLDTYFSMNYERFFSLSISLQKNYRFESLEPWCPGALSLGALEPWSLGALEPC